MSQEAAEHVRAILVSRNLLESAQAGRTRHPSFKNLLFAQNESVTTLVFIIKTNKQTKHPELLD